MKGLIESHLQSAIEEMSLANFERLASAGETRFIERKSIEPYRDIKRHRDEITAEISKQVSAFSNYEGGAILIGADDDGNAEEGIDDVFGRQTVREWLQDVVNSCVTPGVKDYAVKRVLRNAKCLFAILVGESSFAPHQAKDNKYYGRIDGKSRPIDGLMVRDIFSRQRMALIEPHIEGDYDPRPGSGGEDRILLKFGIRNNSRTCAEMVLAIVKFVPRNPPLQFASMWNDGGSFLNRDGGQLKADIVYPGVTHFFHAIEMKPPVALQCQVALVARNSPMRRWTFDLEGDKTGFRPTLLATQ